MDNKIFFKYYIPALKKALVEDHINYGSMIKGPDWWYPKELYEDMEIFEESHYEEYPLLEHAAYYFDAKGHGFSEMFYLSIDDYRKKVLRELSEIEEEFKEAKGAYIPKREQLKANLLSKDDLMVEFPEDKRDYYVNLIIESLNNSPLYGKYKVGELSSEYIILNKGKKTPKWDLQKMGLSSDID